ncbi:penicillin acylase family protein [uncultured Salipiger sp.]|uniref:penicillin acylase family protein n=1 Tax=uncultured Salipiger sp. TaxID=499810 RepID=UPI0025998FEC|nr:penicillin acylase family protein [uncultured Salipiger sp.]
MGGGSNNWAVSGDVTDTGQPILIGDPHRELEMPGMYAQAHVAGARFDTAGLTVPGGPGFPHVGHNAQVAWCVTHAMADIQDLFIERFKDGGRRSLHKGAWRETEVHEEILRVRGQDAPERVTIHRTCHGPVICGDHAGAAPSRWPRRSSPGASTASTACHGCCAPGRRPSSTRRRAAGR